MKDVPASAVKGKLNIASEDPDFFTSCYFTLKVPQALFCDIIIFMYPTNVPIRSV